MSRNLLGLLGFLGDARLISDYTLDSGGVDFNGSTLEAFEALAFFFGFGGSGTLACSSSPAASSIVALCAAMWESEGVLD